MSSLLEKAILLHKKGSLKEAEEIYKDIYKKNPSSFEVTHLLGALKIQLKDYNESINWISKALILNPESGPSYNNFGAAYLGLKKYVSDPNIIIKKYEVWSLYKTLFGNKSGACA
jgi:tetratricopeptide (TPR) repeat protein